MRAWLAGMWLLTGCGGFERVTPPAETDSDTGQGSVLVGELSLSSTSLDFGEVQVGASRSLNLVATNAGDDPATLLSALLEGDDSFSFTSTTDLPGTLHPADQVVFTLTFAPDQDQAFNGTFKLETDILDAEQVDVALSGQGQPSEADGPNGQIVVTPSTLDLGLVDVDREESGSLLVRNVGDADLLVDDILLGDSHLSYDIEGYLPILLSPGDSKDVDILLNPGSQGLFSSWVQFVSDDPDDPTVQIPVTADVQDLCDICAPVIRVDTGGADNYSMSFFIMIAFARTDTRAVSVRNAGDEPLVIANVYVTNDWFSLTGTFTHDWTGPEIIDPGDSTRFNVTFAADSLTGEVAWPDTDWNILHIKNNDPSEPDYAIELSASAI